MGSDEACDAGNKVVHDGPFKPPLLALERLLRLGGIANSRKIRFTDHQ
jgi:hypothetical protein